MKPMPKDPGVRPPMPDKLAVKKDFVSKFRNYAKGKMADDLRDLKGPGDAPAVQEDLKLEDTGGDLPTDVPTDDPTAGVIDLQRQGPSADDAAKEPDGDESADNLPMSPHEKTPGLRMVAERSVEGDPMDLEHIDPAILKALLGDYIAEG